MKKLKIVKSQLKKQKLLRSYSKTFKNKQMHFLTTKIIYDVYPNCDSWAEIASIEASLITMPKNEKMFVEAFKKMGEIIAIKGDWTSLGKCAFYCYQTSTYWKDSKRGISNIFTKDNFVEMNNKKRKHFSTWLHSIERESDFNSIVQKVLWRVF